ncbi:HNH endonuclease [Thiospirillum jenense]|uniref:HNH endonuclease n=1 Tax=Thiospirillum jenense TaxID=1653858 RepID=A0A839HEI0_9GAMM|nr:HNH endonuclease signature motif containing protein [Thiospirillum jenense]MBB1125648.1 HNH endonuclease [Thiospirillum jenense]
MSPPLYVDFSALHEAVRKMGANTFSPELEIEQGTDVLTRIDIELSTGGISVELKDVDFDTGLLAYKGRQVLLYIQDHGPRVQQVLNSEHEGNKYHVAFCSTLKKMQDIGRYERYVATNDTSGQFFISGLSSVGASVDGIVKLSICKNCLRRLMYKGYPNKREQIFKEFSLQAFFETYSSFFPHMPKRIAGDPHGETYTSDWTIVAGNYKSSQNYHCESCGIVLDAHKKLLHVHHRNGVKSDNAINNLQALCVDCHRKQPLHNHMFVKHTDMQLLNQLRREQGIVNSILSYEQTFRFADPGVHGVLYGCQEANVSIPEIGYILKDANGVTKAYLELAWPRTKRAVAIAEADIMAARELGWTVRPMIEALEAVNNK